MKSVKALSLLFLLLSCSKPDSSNLEEPAQHGGGIVVMVGDNLTGPSEEVLRKNFVHDINDAINATVKVRHKNAMGTGFVANISRQPGRGKWEYTILSAAHVFTTEIENEESTPHILGDTSNQVSVTFYNNKDNVTLYGNVVSLDTVVDLAIVKVSGSSEGMPICKSFWFYQGDEYLKYMNDVAIIGYPQGIGPIVTVGHISGISVLSWDKEAYTTTAQSAPGSSGGPVVDLETGKVVGMIRAVLRMPSNQQLILWTSIITPVDAVRKFFSSYISSIYLPETKLDDVTPGQVRGEEVPASGTPRFTPSKDGKVLVFTPHESKQVFYRN